MTEFKGFTEKSNAALNRAMDIAMRLGHTFVGSEHILYGLSAGRDGAAALLLHRHGVKENDILAGTERIMGRGISTRLTIRDFTPLSKRILEHAIDFASQDGRCPAGTEYLLAAILSERLLFCSFVPMLIPPFCIRFVQPVRRVSMPWHTHLRRRM